ncbi:MAG: helix-turn-helix transcriptional regulator [Clostridia bacterium]|nr:helix-turn-helix transcriptional regulator [Clostridia bacterium]
MENTTEKIIAQNLIDLRKHKNLKQAELSEAIGYSDKTISRWENGTSTPDISTLIKLAKFYNVTLEDLVSENVIGKYDENSKQKNQEEINIYSVLSLAVVTAWLIAVLVYVGLIMIKQIYFWQIFISAIPVSCIIIYRKTRKNFNLKWLNLLLLTLTTSSLLAFFYFTYIKYNFWQLFILFIPMEGINVISALFPKRYPKAKK